MTASLAETRRPPSLTLDGVSVHYGAQVAIQGASLTVAPGELMALWGPVVAARPACFPR